MKLLSKESLLTNLSTITNSIHSSVTQFHLLVAFAFIVALLCYYYSKSNNTYLIDFVCYLPPDTLRVPPSNFIEHTELCTDLDRESKDFQTKVCKRSGIGGEACMPKGTHQIPFDDSLTQTKEEIEQVLFSSVQILLDKHEINPKEIDILVSNCSLFCSFPSMSAMIVNKFGFRSDVKSVSLSGMGCSAGLLSISLARDLLKVHKNSLALVLSMEAVTCNPYLGKTKSMILANTLFKMGGVAILLSNKKQDKCRSKYQLQNLVRTDMGSDDQSYSSVVQRPDEEGLVGVSLSRSLLYVAANALKTNLSGLGPQVLPYSEQFKYVLSVLRKKIWVVAKEKEVYVPDFKKCFDHFCIHAGGRAVIDAVEANLKLNKYDGEASRMTLYRFGNTSSSSVWYELCYLEAKGRVKKGDQVWQIAFGSGFKCNSAVWKCISDIDTRVGNAWFDRVHLYPVEIPDEFSL